MHLHYIMIIHRYDVYLPLYYAMLHAYPSEILHLHMLCITMNTLNTKTMYFVKNYNKQTKQWAPLRSQKHLALRDI